MKAWQTRSKEGDAKKSTEGDAPVALSERVKVVDALLKSSDAYWKKAGAMKPRACQFEIDGGNDWFIVVDKDGGRASLGALDKADVVWRSDLEAFEAVFAGQLLPGRIQVEGDFDALKDIFKAISG